MRSSRDFLWTLDSTGLPQKSLLSRTMGSDIPGKKNAFSQLVSGDVVVFPKIEPCVAPGRAAVERPLQTIKERVEKRKGEVRREKEAMRIGSVTDKHRLLSRGRLSPARLPWMTAERELGEAARAKEPSLRLPSVFKESSSRKGEDKKHKWSAIAWPEAVPSVCESHQRAGQDIHYPCLQWDEGSPRASLAGEHLQREQEDEPVWAEHKAPRERDAAKRAWVQLMPRRPLSLWGGMPKAGVAPVDLKQHQRQFFIPHPPEKKMEAAALEKSLTNCFPMRGTQVRRLLEKRKEAL